MERYTLHRGKNFMWTCKDALSGMEISFREGMFNETQNINIDHIKGIDNPLQMPSLLTGMSDWLSLHYDCILSCHIVERGDAIRTLSNESYWKLLCDILNGHIVTSQDDADALCAAVVDAEFPIYKKWEVEREELADCLERLLDKEAYEVFRIVDAFWQMQGDFNIDIDTWARDLLWWPAFIPQERREPQSVESFGQELNDARQAVGLSITELSNRSGVDFGLISKIENGKANPTLQTLLKLANAMGTDLTFEA